MSLTTFEQALAAEFTGTVAFSATPPTSFNSPGVYITPGDPFLQTTTHGLIEERWDVLVVVSIQNPAAGLSQMRDLSIRIRTAIATVGGLWQQASAPFLVSGDNNRSLAVSQNLVTVKYDPNP